MKVKPEYSIREVSPSLFKDDMGVLFQQLSPGKYQELPDDFLLKYSAEHPAYFRMFGAVEIATDTVKQDRVVSMATLAFAYTAEKRFGQVHDVVTDKAHRGRQCGRDMSLAEEVLLLLIRYASMKELSYLELTSKPDREVANALYKKLGFQLIAEAVPGGTNLYRMKLQK